MGKVIHFPVPKPAASHPRVRRVFEAQREMEQAQHHAHVMMLGAFLTASLMMITLSVLAAVS